MALTNNTDKQHQMEKGTPFELTKQRLANGNAGKAKHANTDTVNRQD